MDYWCGLYDRWWLDGTLNNSPVFKLHHAGYLVANLDDAAQNFGFRFGYRIESDVIHDPVQTAFVQFLRLPLGTSWLELITPDDENSKLTRALKGGSSLHHLCFEVDDIEQAGVRLREQAMLALSVPVAATAFPGRRISWFMDREKLLIELLEQGTGPLSLGQLRGG